jgi:F-type H+-transporting ATPase subunit epsilon
MPLQLEIVTPERQVYSDTVDSVQVPGSEGELGVLPHHAPLVSTLGVGELRFRKDGTEESFAIVGGFLQVRPDRVVVLAETADLASDIDARPNGRSSRGSTRARISAPHVRSFSKPYSGSGWRNGGTARARATAASLDG